MFQKQAVCPAIPIEVAAIPPHAILAIARTMPLQVVELVPDPVVGLVQCRGLHIVIHSALARPESVTAPVFITRAHQAN